MRINILLIGLGPHARRIQLPILLRDGKKYKAQVKAIIDLESQAPIIKSYLEERSLESLELVFLKDDLSNNNVLSNELKNLLNDITTKLKINAVFICTDPRCHTSYAKWALSKGLHVFMDKPISAPYGLTTNAKSIDQLVGDYKELIDIYKRQKCINPHLVFELMAQRRYHPAFHELDRLIREVQEKTGSPITSFQSTHSDGQWRMPDEIVDQAYHPYNQGYGKCLHSGYHSIDITNWLVRRSYAQEHIFNEIEVASNFVYPHDFIAQLPLENYDKLFDNFKLYRKYPVEDLESKYKFCGEIDAHISVNYKDINNRTLTVGQLALLHNGFGQRNWPTAEGRDLYKGNGRVRHESHYLVQGPFQTIVFQSLQSEEILNERVNHSNVGGEYHLDIHIFRNNNLFPSWKSYEKINLKDLTISILNGYSRGHQEDARRSAVLTFLKAIHKPETKRYSDILDHDFTIGTLGAAYRSAFYKKLGRPHLIRVKDELEGLD